MSAVNGEAVLIHWPDAAYSVAGFSADVQTVNVAPLGEAGGLKVPDGGVAVLFRLLSSGSTGLN